MDEHRLVFLTPGQQASIPGSTGIALENGGIMWIGEEGTFNSVALLGNHLPTDPEFSTTYNSRSATTEEVQEYEAILNAPPEEPE